jgi:hypothetical protein
MIVMFESITDEYSVGPSSPHHFSFISYCLHVCSCSKAKRRDKKAAEARKIRKKTLQSRPAFYLTDMKDKLF